MSRPKSMSDFAALLDASTPISASARPRKKPSISLAAGLIMNAESPRTIEGMSQHLNGNGHANGDGRGTEEASNGNLFYAYAQKSDCAISPPYILTFANVSVADQWWTLVQREYPSSTREGPQLFILKGDDMQEQIQDNPRFYALRNKWFYTPSDVSAPVIPLQDYKGNLLAAAGTNVSGAARKNSRPAIEEERNQEDNSFGMKKLDATLDKMNAMISSNSAQIAALSVAQSAGLQRMQEINESNSTQIKALADSQAKLQSLIDQNASHYIALSNASFASQETVKSTLQQNTNHIKALADGQDQLATTCTSLIKTIETIGSAVGSVGESIKEIGTGSDTSSVINPFSSGSMANRISPPPRKLNRRIKGVWYEYDGTSSVSSPRRSLGLETPPKSPLSTITKG